uniref:Uncharacterized protein n=1 Tax=Megaviridae environmental sample TaxID=1737588 RepID=A0A5J6VM26_9VIRU|nr:MAG: hypothetical protein [Megaviridae environmental sample]
MIILLLLTTILSIYWFQNSSKQHTKNKYKIYFNNVKIPLFLSLVMLYIFNYQNTYVNNNLILKQEFNTSLHDF